MFWNKITYYKVFRYLAMAPVLGVPATVIACGDETDDKPTIIIAVTSDSYNYPKAITSFAKQAAELRGYQVQVVVTNEDTAVEQNKIMQIVTAKNVKGVVLVPSKKIASAVVIKKLNAKEIPVVIIDRTIAASTEAKMEGSILTDNAKAAESLVKYAKDSFASSIEKIYIANGEAGGDSAIDRKTGFKNGLNKHFAGKQIVSEVDTPGWSLENAQKKFATLSSQFYGQVPSGKKGLILSAAIPMTNGIVGAGGFNGAKSVVIGFDIDKTNTANLKNGKIQAAGMQRPDIMSTWAVAKLNMKIKSYTAAQEKEKYYKSTEFQTLAPLSEKDVKLPITIITKSNIDKIVY